MSSSLPRPVRALRIALLAVGFAVTIPAQVVINGPKYDGAGGPLTAGQVYIVNGSLSVPSGQTLTIQAGAILKFYDAVEMVVSGTLNVNGTAASPVYFTSMADDTVGGDTNGNGPSTGSPDDWRGLYFYGSASASALHHARVRFPGDYYYAGIELNGASILLDNCTVSGGSREGLDLNNTSAFPTVTGCTFTGNASYAVDNVRLDAVPGFTNNSASGNGGNFMRMVNNTISGNRSIAAVNCLNGALVCVSTVSIPSTDTLTLGPGVTLKFVDAVELIASGTLLANGTAGSPVTFTSYADDAVAGDTNNNGPSAGAPDDWRGLYFYGSASASALHHARVRFGGDYYYAGIELNGASILLDQCTISGGSREGLDLNNTAAFPTVTGCTFTGNASNAVDNVRIDSVPGFTNNTASGNGGNFMRIVNGSLAADRTIVPANCLQGALVMVSTVSIPSGLTLTLEAGVVLKFIDAVELIASGRLLVNGTGASPVTFTSYRDDAVAGDTNNNGLSAGVPDDWRGLYFYGSASASVLRHASIRYGGDYYYAGIDLNAASITLEDCTIAYGSQNGLDLNNTAAFPTVTRCTFTGNAGPAVDNVRLDCVPGFVNNFASGNGLDAIRIVNDALSADRAIGPENCLNGALWIASGISVPGSTRLTLRAGTVLKFQDAVAVIVSGALDALGTSFHPVVFTSTHDDAWAGDTDKNGPSTGAPDDWRGLYFYGSPMTATLENVLVRYPGDYYYAGIEIHSSNLTARSVRVEYGSRIGIDAWAHSGAAANWVVFACSEIGIRAQSGSFQLAHATVASCGGAGITAAAAYTGPVVSSISWGNGGGNFTGFGPGRLTACDGSAAHAGANGNINVDPLFVNPAPASGDLHLLSGSPCLNTGDIPTALAVVKDWDENSRGLDHALNGLMLPDMGAYERAAYVLDVTGVPRLGSSLQVGVNGPAGTVFYAIGPLDGNFLLVPYGYVTAGLLSSLIVFPTTFATGQVLTIDLPQLPSLVGIQLGLQAAGIPLANPSVGNITRLYRATIRP